MKQRSQTAANLRYSTIDGLYATPWLHFTNPGSFITAGLLNELFAIGPFWFGIVVAMPAVANAINIFLVPLVSKFMNVREMMLSFGWLNLGAWTSGAVAIAFSPVGEAGQIGLFFTAIFAVLACSGSLMGIGFVAWLTDFVPSRIRGRYMGRRNRLTSFATIAFMVLSIGVLNFFGATRNVYLTLIALSIVMRFASMLYVHRIQSPDPTGGAIAQANWGRELANLREQKSLLRFIAFGSVAGFFLAFQGALATIFAFGALGATAAQFTGFSLFATISSAIFLPIWGRVIDKHGSLPTIIISLVAWRLNDLGYLFITPDTLEWLNLMWFTGGALGGGFMLGTFTLLLKLIPKTSRSAGISLNLTLTSIAGATAPMLAGLLTENISAVPFDTMTAYRIGFGVAILCALLSALILVGMKEPETDPRHNTIFGAMRSLKQMAVTNGLALFTSNFFVRTQRKRPNDRR